MPKPGRPQPIGPPSPQKPTIYSGPLVPVSYDPDWQYFTNLTSDQIAWFQARPEWQNFLSYVALSPTIATVAAPIAVVNSGLQAAGQIPIPPISITAHGPIV